MEEKPTQNKALTIRSATSDDFPTLSDLMVQLYAAELPGALTGERALLSRVIRFTLEAQPAQALLNRYILADADGQTLATGMIQFPTIPPFDRAPDGTIAMALRTLGYRATGRLLLTVARSRVAVHVQHQADTALVHSYVVDERQRGQGFGRVMLNALEQKMTEAGCQWSELQVLAGNTVARNLYIRSGYKDVGRPPRWAEMLSWPSYVMRKAL